MNKAKLQFWLTCPQCKKKIGVSPELILKYLERISSVLKLDLEAAKDEVSKVYRPATARPPANLPTE